MVLAKNTHIAQLSTEVKELKIELQQVQEESTLALKQLKQISLDKNQILTELQTAEASTLLLKREIKTKEELLQEQLETTEKLLK